LKASISFGFEENFISSALFYHGLDIDYIHGWNLSFLISYYGFALAIGLPSSVKIEDFFGFDIPLCCLHDDQPFIGLILASVYDG
jgi:hypothetical protein